MWFCRWIYVKKQTWRSSRNHPKNQPYRASLYQRSRESVPVSGIALAYWKWLHPWQAEEHGSYVSEGMFFWVVKNSLRHLGMCQNRHCLWGTSMRTSYFGYLTVTRGLTPGYQAWFPRASTFWKMPGWGSGNHGMEQVSLSHQHDNLEPTRNLQMRIIFVINISRWQFEPLEEYW